MVWAAPASARRGAGGNGNGLGGAIFNLNGSVALTNSTVAANTTAVGLGVGGGGIFNTVYDKSTARTASVTLVNTILADSTGGPADLVTNKPPAVADGGTNLGTAPVDATASNLVELPADPRRSHHHRHPDRRRPPARAPRVQPRAGHGDHDTGGHQSGVQRRPGHRLSPAATSAT